MNWRPLGPVLLLPTFAVAFLYAENRSEVRVSDVPPALAGAVLVCFAMYGVLLALSRRADEAGLATAVGGAFFFGYGHVRTLLATADVSPFLMSHRALLPAWTAFGVATAILVVRRSRDPAEANRIVLAGLLVMLLVPAWQIGAALASQADDAPAAALGAATEDFPSIYYVVLDGYANPWTLERIYGYDDTWFVENLTARGFIVVDESRSNYGFTTLSMASALNMRYVNELPTVLGETSQDGHAPLELIRKNSVESLLRERGYRTVHITTGFEPAGPRLADLTVRCGTLTDFDELAIQSTALAFLTNHLAVDRRERIECAFERLGEIAPVDGRPVFVYAHMLTPHAPYLFDAHGGAISADLTHLPLGGARFEVERPLYVGQLHHANVMTLRAIDEILADARNDTIVIVQSDHGAGLSEEWSTMSPQIVRDRMRNFEAVRLPPGSTADLYRGITPVNMFRVIFDAHLGTDLGTLADESYFSEFEFPYRLHNVTATASSGWD